MYRQRFLSFWPALVLAILPAAALASDNPASHQHGQARLQIALDGERADVLLQSPAANLIGFEHAPETGEQHQKLGELSAWARQTPLINTTRGNCTVTKADVHGSWPSSHEHDHEHQDDGHADIEISQTLACPELAASNELETTIMTRFSAMEQLDIQWVSPQGQGGTRLSHGQNHFPLHR